MCGSVFCACVGLCVCVCVGRCLLLKHGANPSVQGILYMKASQNKTVTVSLHCYG